MAMQNIYDNETFFEGYRKIRENKMNEPRRRACGVSFVLLRNCTQV